MSDQIELTRPAPSFGAPHRVLQVSGSAYHAATHGGKTVYQGAKGWLSDFKKFIDRGNVVDLAVGIVIGSAFTGIVNSLVGDVITPVIGLAVGSNLNEAVVVIGHNANSSVPLRFSYKSRMEAKADGAVTIDYGNFLQQCINFLVIAGIVFLMVKMYQGFKRTYKHEKKALEKEEKEAAVAAGDERKTQMCKFCAEEISVKAQRCSKCTSWLQDGAGQGPSGPSQPSYGGKF